MEFPEGAGSGRGGGGAAVRTVLGSTFAVAGAGGLFLDPVGVVPVGVVPVAVVVALEDADGAAPPGPALVPSSPVGNVDVDAGIASALGGDVGAATSEADVMPEDAGSFVLPVGTRSRNAK